MIFDWCRAGTHSECKKEYQKFYVDPKSNKVVHLDEWVHCDCLKRGCPCAEEGK